MGVETLVVAIGEESTPQSDAIAQTILDIAEPTEIRVIIAYIFSENTYERALSDLEDRSQTVLEKRFTEQLPKQPGFEGDFPEWTKRWSQQQIRGNQAQDELPQSEAVKQILNRKESLQKLADTFETADIEYEIRGAVGDPVEHIIRVIEDVDADFVVVSSRDRPHVRERLFGDVAQKLLRSAPCPVITVREGLYE